MQSKPWCVWWFMVAHFRPSHVHAGTRVLVGPYPVIECRECEWAYVHCPNALLIVRGGRAKPTEWAGMACHSEPMAEGLKV